MNRSEMISALGLTAAGAVVPTAASALTQQTKRGTASSQISTPAIASSSIASAQNPYANCIKTAKNCVASAEICHTKMMALLVVRGKQCMNALLQQDKCFQSARPY